MKCPKCTGLTKVRPITGHESPFDQMTGVTTRTRDCKDPKCAATFKTYERIDADDAELRRRAFRADMAEAEVRRWKAKFDDLTKFIEGMPA